MKRIYLGRRIAGTTLQQSDILRCDYTPTQESHGKRYSLVIGPFRTVRGAEFMRQYGQGNPHCRTVAEAEALAKKYQREAEREMEDRKTP